MELRDTDRREVCDLHGWVGRAAFQRDRHDLCEVPAAQEEAAAVEVRSRVPEGVPTIQYAFRGKLRRKRASMRQRGVPRKRTLAIKKISRFDLVVGRSELRALGADETFERPRVRVDCAGVPRPCPYVGCKHNNYLDVNPDTGSITFNFPHLEPHEMDPERSCSLDLAERGGMTLDEIGEALSITRERARQIEVRASVKKLAPAMREVGIDASDADGRWRASPGAQLEEGSYEGELPSDVTYLITSVRGE